MTQIYRKIFFEAPVLSIGLLWRAARRLRADNPGAHKRRGSSDSPSPRSRHVERADGKEGKRGAAPDEACVDGGMVA